MARIFIVSILMLVSSHGFAQQSTLDSLLRELGKHAKEDTFRLNILNSLALVNVDINPRQGLKSAEVAIALAKKLSEKKKLALAYKLKSNNYSSMDEDSLALLSYQEALSVYESIAFKQGIAKTCFNMGIILSNTGDYSRALLFEQRAAKVFEEAGDLENMSNALNSIGVNYNYLSDYPRALECYLRSMRNFEQLSLTNTMGMANVFVNLGLVYKNLSNFGRALQYQEKALDLYKKLAAKQGMANVYGNLGAIYDNILNQEKALESYLFASSLNLELGDKRRIASDYVNIGIIYSGMTKYSEAFQYLNKALNLYKVLADTNNGCLALAEMGKIYLKAPAPFLKQQGIDVSKRYILAIGYQRTALRIARETGSLLMEQTALEYLASSYEAQKNYVPALDAYKQYLVIHDSIYSSEKQDEITRKELQYEFDKTQASIKAANDKSRALAAAEIGRQRVVKNAAMSGLGILVLAGLFSFVFYKKKRDAEVQKKEAEFQVEVTDTEMKALRSQMNPHFIFNSLNSISDYISRHDISAADNYLTKFAKLMRVILENSEQKNVNLSDDLKALEIYMQLESIRLHHKFSYEIIIDDAIDKEATLIPPLILQPFVENSIWHGIARKDGNGTIRISIKREGDMINCSVEDDGIGRSLSVSLKPRNKSLGMKITNSRIDIINKIKKSKAAVKVIDLQQGTRVEVLLPLELAF